MKIKSTYFYGNKVSEYGIENGRVDYATLAKSFDAVLVNDITKLFYSTVNGEYFEPEIVNGYIDNTEEIADLTDELESLQSELDEITDEKTARTIQNNILLLKNEIDELEWQQHESENPEIYQYYIISDNGARMLQEYTNEIVYYIDFLDIYIWGVTHYGTSWNYVLTDIEIDLEGDSE